MPPRYAKASIPNAARNPSYDLSIDADRGADSILSPIELFRDIRLPTPNL